MLWRRISPSVQTSTIAEGYWIARLELSGSTFCGVRPGVAVDPTTGNTAMMNYWGGLTPQYVVVNLFDNDGALVWSVELTQQSSAYAAYLTFDSSGDVIVNYRRTRTDLDVQLIRLNAADGSVDTDRFYSSVGTDSPGKIIPDGSGNFIHVCTPYVVSTIEDLSANNWYFRENSSYGSIMYPQMNWTKSGGTTFAIGAAYTNGSSPSGYDTKPIVSVIDSSGTVQWRRAVTNTITNDTDRQRWGGGFYSCYVDSDDSVYVANLFISHNNSYPTTRHIVKFDSSGSVSWQKEYTSTDTNDYNSTWPASVCVTDADNAVIRLPRPGGGVYRTLSKSTGSEVSATWVSGGGSISEYTHFGHDTYLLAASVSGAYTYVYRLPADIASLHGSTYNGISFSNDTTSSWTSNAGTMTFGTPSVTRTTTGLSFSTPSPTDATSSSLSGVTDTTVSIP